VIRVRTPCRGSVRVRNAGLVPVFRYFFRPRGWLRLWLGLGSGTHVVGRLGAGPRVVIRLGSRYGLIFALTVGECRRWEEKLSGGGHVRVEYDRGVNVLHFQTHCSNQIIQTTRNRRHSKNSSEWIRHYATNMLIPLTFHVDYFDRGQSVVYSQQQ